MVKAQLAAGETATVLTDRATTIGRNKSQVFPQSRQMRLIATSLFADGIRLN
jgi:hypothetical protein